MLGKFHPHGDQSVYDALVRMAQDFSMSSALVDGHGNFGSLDADPPRGDALHRVPPQARRRGDAAGGHRSRRRRLHRDVRRIPDRTRGAPRALTQLLINGSTGIAVGMATSIPPHNLREVANALVRFASDPERCTLEDLLEVMPAPDFPTGGIIVQQRGGFKEMYRTGKGA